MILIPLVVVSLAVTGIALVVLLDWAGVLSPPGGGGRDHFALLEHVSQRAQIGALLLMGAWVVAWTVILVVGLGVLSV